MRIVVMLAMLSFAAMGQEQLPKVETIIEQYVKASGGAELDKIKTTFAIGTLSIKGNGMNGSCKLITKSPGKSYMEMSLPLILTSRSGNDGKVAWAEDPIQGVRELGAKEKALARLGEVDVLRKYKEHFISAEVVGIQNIDSKPCYKVKFVPRPIRPDGTVAKIEPGENIAAAELDDDAIINLDPIYVYFDKTTGLPARMSVVNDGPLGRIHADLDMSDYIDVNGKIKLPGKITMRMMQAAIVMQFSKYQLNVTIDDDIFKMPDPKKPRKADDLGAVIFQLAADGTVTVLGRTLKVDDLGPTLKQIVKAICGKNIPYAKLRVNTKVPYEILSKVLIPLQMNCGQLKIEQVK